VPNPSDRLLSQFYLSKGQVLMLLQQHQKALFEFDTAVLFDSNNSSICGIPIYSIVPYPVNRALCYERLGPLENA